MYVLMVSEAGALDHAYNEVDKRRLTSKGYKPYVKETVKETVKKVVKKSTKKAK